MSQNKTRVTTLQQKFGFQDTDLSTPAHDALMVWLDQNIESVLMQRYPTVWTEQEINREMAKARREFEDGLEKLQTRVRQEKEWLDQVTHPYQTKSAQNSYDNACERYEQLKNAYTAWNPGPPPPLFVGVAQKVWECPVMARNGFLVGFIDMKVVMERNYVRMEHGKWCEHPPASVNPDDIYLLEVKPRIQSAGELIRQIRMYQSYQQGTYIIVSPDDRFASVLADQGIEFLKAPANL